MNLSEGMEKEVVIALVTSVVAVCLGFITSIITLIVGVKQAKATLKAAEMQTKTTMEAVAKQIEGSLKAAEHQSEKTLEAAKVQSEKTLEAATVQANATVKVVAEQIQAEQKVRLKLARQELRRQVGVLSNALIHPLERLMSRFVTLCTLDTLRHRTFRETPEFEQAVQEYDRQFHNYYDHPFDPHRAEHLFNQGRCTFVVYLFRCLGAIGAWRDRVYNLVPATDRNVSAATEQLRRLEQALCSIIPQLAPPWFSRDHLHLIEDAFIPADGTADWDWFPAAMDRIRGNTQLTHAAELVNANFLGMFERTAPMPLLRARQVRGALVAILLLDFIKLVLPEFRFPFYTKRNRIWNTVVRDFAGHLNEKEGKVEWYLYTRGDVLTSPECPSPVVSLELAQGEADE